MNKVFATWGLLVSLCAGSALAGCSDDSGGDSSGGAGSGTAGSGTAGSGTAGSGTAGSGTAGSGGSDAGAGGSSVAGSGGSDAGSGGSGGSGQAGDMVAGCTMDNATDLTAGNAVVMRDGFEYTLLQGGVVLKPACAKIKVGQSVTFINNSGTHPLKGMTSIGTQPNPLAGPASTEQTVTYDKAGIFGFYCTAHGGEVATQPEAGMAGAIIVVE